MKPQSDIELISPKIAAEYLKHNQSNRPVKPRLVARIAAEINEGRWCLNGQPIIFSDRGTLLDGQHRLLAVIESGASVQAMVTRGVDEQSFASMDSGLSRQGADVLAIRGVTNYRSVAAALSLLVLWDSNRQGQYLRDVSSTKVAQVVSIYPNLEVIVANVHAQIGRNRSLPKTLVAAAAHQFSRVDASEAERWLVDLAVGANLATDDPVFVLRRRLQESSWQTLIPRWQAIAMMVVSWNHRRLGVRPDHYKLWSPSRPFPKVDGLTAGRSE